MGREGPSCELVWRGRGHKWRHPPRPSTPAPMGLARGPYSYLLRDRPSRSGVYPEGKGGDTYRSAEKEGKIEALELFQKTALSTSTLLSFHAHSPSSFFSAAVPRRSSASRSTSHQRRMVDVLWIFASKKGDHPQGTAHDVLLLSG